MEDYLDGPDDAELSSEDYLALYAAQASLAIVVTGAGIAELSVTIIDGAAASAKPAPPLAPPSTSATKPATPITQAATAPTEAAPAPPRPKKKSAAPPEPPAPPKAASSAGGPLQASAKPKVAMGATATTSSKSLASSPPPLPPPPPTSPLTLAFASPQFQMLTLALALREASNGTCTASVEFVVREDSAPPALSSAPPAGAKKASATPRAPKPPATEAPKARGRPVPAPKPRASAAETSRDATETHAPPPPKGGRTSPPPKPAAATGTMSGAAAAKPVPPPEPKAASGEGARGSGRPSKGSRAAKPRAGGSSATPDNPYPHGARSPGRGRSGAEAPLNVHVARQLHSEQQRAFQTIAPLLTPLFMADEIEDQRRLARAQARQVTEGIAALERERAAEVERARVTRQSEMIALETKLADAVQRRHAALQEEAETLQEEAVQSVVQHLSSFGLNRNLPWQIYATRPKRFAHAAGGQPPHASSVGAPSGASEALLGPVLVDPEGAPLEGNPSLMGPEEAWVAAQQLEALYRQNPSLNADVLVANAGAPRSRVHHPYEASARPRGIVLWQGKHGSSPRQPRPTELPPVRGALPPPARSAWPSPRTQPPLHRATSPRVLAAPGAYY